jgi:hypothetical protein
MFKTVELIQKVFLGYNSSIDIKNHTGSNFALKRNLLDQTVCRDV